MNPIPTEIVYFAVNRWDSIVQREQHLMMGLSRTYRILFVDPPLSFLTILLGKIRGKKWTFRSRLHWVNDRLIVYTPPAFPPLSQYIRWVYAMNTDLLISLAKGLIHRFSFENFIVGIARPFLAEAVKDLKPRFSYYDCMDDYLEFPGWRADKALLKRSEEELLKSVNLIFCSSRGLKEAKSIFNQNCFLLPNGVDFNLFHNHSSDAEIPPNIKMITKPILGYIGTLGEWFDFENVVALAKNRPDWSIVLIGPLTSRRFSSFFAGIPNIYWLGEKDEKELYPYLESFDLCLIPFQVNDFTKKIYPTKLHQYLAAGKPVVSSPLPDLEPFTPWVGFYSDVKELERNVERLLKDDSEESLLERKKIAHENTWDSRVQSIINIFNTFLGGN